MNNFYTTPQNRDRRAEKLWRKNIASNCNVIHYDDPRILGIEVVTEEGPLLFVNVYLPFCCRDNMEEFNYYLGVINNIIMAYKSPYVYIMGDFNADIAQVNGQYNQLFGKELLSFCNLESLVIADKKMLPADSYSFYSSAHRSTSWLDHVVTTIGGYELLYDMHICTDCITSDHLPIVVTVNLNELKCTPIVETTKSHFRIDWNDATEEDISKYQSVTKHKLSSIPLNHNLLLCNDPNCKLVCHIDNIDKMYNSIINALKEAGHEVFGKSKCHKKGKDFQVGMTM